MYTVERHLPYRRVVVLARVAVWSGCVAAPYAVAAAVVGGVDHLTGGAGGHGYVAAALAPALGASAEIIRHAPAGRRRPAVVGSVLGAVTIEFALIGSCLRYLRRSAAMATPVFAPIGASRYWSGLLLIGVVADVAGVAAGIGKLWRPRRPRTLGAWVLQLTARGFFVSPHSTGVPVQIWGLLPDGLGFRFWCRGVRVVLCTYERSRARWEVRVLDPAWTPETTLQCWDRYPVERQAALPPGARLVFDRECEPDVRVIYDGDRACGWTWCEAGRLRVAEAAELFDRLLPEARRLARRSRLSARLRRVPPLKRQPPSAATMTHPSMPGSGGVAVLVNEAAEDVIASDASELRDTGRW